MDIGKDAPENNCKGDGTCLEQTDMNEYSSKNNCKYSCSPIKCPNFLICGTILPKWVADCHGGVCVNCDITFGNWSGKSNNGNEILFSDDIECPICLDENLKGCTMLNCDHKVCVSCFKKLYGYNIEDKYVYPDFPIPELEKEFDNDPDNEKWMKNPLIVLYLLTWNEIDDQRLSAYEDNENLQKCPLCRQ